MEPLSPKTQINVSEALLIYPHNTPPNNAPQMRDGTVGFVEPNTLYVRKHNDKWSFVIMRTLPHPQRMKLTHLIFDYSWRPRTASHPGGVESRRLSRPPMIPGEFFHFGSSPALRVWSAQLEMKDWTKGNRGRKTANINGRRKEDRDSKCWVFEAVHGLHAWWFRSTNVISQAAKLRVWMSEES